MMFETNNKDVMLHIERILEVEKDRKRNAGQGHSYFLNILTLDTKKTIRYEEEKDRDLDYEKIKQSLLLNDKIDKAIKELSDVLKG